MGYKEYTMYYVRFDNKIISEHELESAFTLVTQKSKYLEREYYLKFLWDLIQKKHIIKCFRSDKVNDDFIASIAQENKILAIKLYRDTHDTTLVEAKTVVENMLNKSEVLI